MTGAGLAAAGAGVDAAFAVGFEGAFTEDVPTGRPALTAAVASAIAFAMPRSGAAVGRVGAAGEGATPGTAAAPPTAAATSDDAASTEARPSSSSFASWA